MTERFKLAKEFEDPPEIRCEHEWTRWLERHDRPGSGMHYVKPTLIGEFCERCGQVRMYRPDPEDEAA